MDGGGKGRGGGGLGTLIGYVIPLCDYVGLAHTTKRLFVVCELHGRESYGSKALTSNPRCKQHVSNCDLSSRTRPYRFLTMTPTIERTGPLTAADEWNQ